MTRTQIRDALLIGIGLLALFFLANPQGAGFIYQNF
jgi:hypothetical protein